ncbi:MAG: methyltransferase [Parasporobacterium sp.]|nr:methyltransferase [Parasporobacterium sp.]
MKSLQKGHRQMTYSKIPFQPSEMQSEEVYQLPFPGAPGILKPRYPISPEENLRRTIAGEPVWIPSDTELSLFAPATVFENVTRGMVIDAKRIPPEEFGGKDYFGVEWVYVPEQRGSMVKPGNPLMEEAGEWRDKIHFPDLSSWDWEDCAKRNAPLLNQGRMIKTPLFTGFFERLVSFMDMQGALIALIDEDQQEDVKELFDRLADFYIKLIGCMRNYFHVDIVWFHDDWGSQRAPMFSYDTVEEMILPSLKKVVDAVHAMGMIFEFHSCGNIETLVPLIVKAGADLWDGQEMNDKISLSHTCKGKLTIEVEPQIRPEMTEEEIRSYIKTLLDQYAPGIALGKTFKGDPRVTPIAYEESRKKYGRLS